LTIYLNEEVLKIIILGAGRRGTRLAYHLSKEDEEISFIDKNKTRLDTVLYKLDCMGILGNGTDIDVLKQANCADADVFIAVTGNDEINIVSCGLVASHFPNVKTIAAIKKLGWSGKNERMGSLLGISEIVNPNIVTAKLIYNIVNNGIYNNIITFNNSDLILYNYSVESSKDFVGKSIQELRQERKDNFVVAAIKNKMNTIVPNGSTIIHDNDILSIVGKPKNLSSLMTNVSKKTKDKFKIVLVGGSMITRFFLRQCTSSQLKNIILIEMRNDICNQFATEFPQIVVLNADITDESILTDSHLTNYDLLISLTESDELNLITATYAKKKGIVRSIALIRHNINYLTMESYLGIDSIISTTESTVETVLSKLRGSNVLSIHSILGGSMEVYEYTVEENTKICGKKLSDINMKGKGIIAAISNKKSRNIVPTGDYVLNCGDNVLVSVSSGNVKYIQQLFIKGK
jgi:trk system potassium uptake protein TrkA